VEGRIRYRSYDDQKGQKRYYTEIDVENMEMLTPKQTMSSTGGSMASEPEPQRPVANTKNDNGDLPF
jgi:single-strand DNA-binding protein